MTSSPRALRTLAASLLSLLLHACGGGSGGAGTPVPPVVQPPVATAGELTLVAGDIGGPGNLDGAGTAARFDRPSGIAVDRDGNTFVLDSGALRRITADGQVSTVAAGVAGSALALDRTGNAYVADPDLHVIRKVAPGGAVTLAAGIENMMGSANGAAAQATFNRPVALAVDAAGNVLIADSGNGLLRKLTPAGQVTTLAGGAPGDCHFISHSIQQCALPADGAGAATHFYFLSDIALGPDGTAYVPDVAMNNADLLRKVAPDGTVSTIILKGASLGSVAVDANGKLYGERYGTIYAIAPDGVATTLAVQDSGLMPSALDSGIRLAARPDGQLVLTNDNKHRIELLAPSGAMSVLAGAAATVGYEDGSGAEARFLCPSDLAFDASGNMFVVDFARNVRKRAPDGAVSTLLRGRVIDFPPDATAIDYCGGLNNSIATDAAGNVYVGGYHEVTKVTPAGVASTLAGGTAAPARDGKGADAVFFNISGMLLDPAGTIYLTDWANLVRQVAPDGTVTSLPEVKGLSLPTGIARDTAGNLFVADRGNHAIVKITPAGVASTVAGAAHTAGYADGSVATAQFNTPSGVAVDTDGSIYVADWGNNMIRRISPAGVVSTVAGAPGARGVRLGALPGSIAGPRGLKWAAPGVLYFATANAVVKLRLPSP